MRREKDRPDWHLLLALAVALLCCLLQDYSAFSFAPAFRIPISPSSWENRRHPEVHERLPLPIVVDLDGDNQTEILSVTPDGKLQLWSMQGDRGTIDEDWPKPRLVKEVALQSTADVGRLGRPIAMTTGKLWSNRTGYETQQQIVVVDDGGAVKCYDAKLKLVWESHLHGDRAQFREHHTREAAVIITSLPLRVGDLGAVIVGRRFQLSNKRPKEFYGRGRFQMQKPEPKSPHDHDTEEGQHFSYYAFDGQTGAVRWRHEAGDFHEIVENPQQGHAGNSYDSKLRHLGEVEWVLYKEDVLASLPHHWYHRGDTRFMLRHFERRTSAGSHAPSTSGLSAADRDRAHTEKPNVVVAFREKGVEIIHLYSGRTLCELNLPSRELHVDQNADGILERVVVERHGAPCFAVAAAGIPPINRLWNVSVCFSIAELFFSTMKNSQDQLAVAPLLALPAPPDAVTESYTYGTAVLVEDGLVTLIDPFGKPLWQKQTPARWHSTLAALRWRQLIASRLPFGGGTMADDTRFSSIPATAGLYRFPIGVGSDILQENILAVGWSLVLLERFTGEQIADAKMPSPPVGEAVVGDFNGDGINDVIIPTAEGYYGFVLERSLSFALYPLIVLLLVGAIGMQFLIRQRQTTTAVAKRKAPPLLKSSHIL